MQAYAKHQIDVSGDWMAHDELEHDGIGLEACVNADESMEAHNMESK